MSELVAVVRIPMRGQDCKCVGDFLSQVGSPREVPQASKDMELVVESFEWGRGLHTVVDGGTIQGPPCVSTARGCSAQIPVVRDLF